MAINKGWVFALLCISGGAESREMASPTSCQAAASQPSIAAAKANHERRPEDLRASFDLADAWSDAGCFNDALQVLQNAAASHGSSDELRTRLRVARSLIGEEHYFDNLERADAEARQKRDVFRCTTLSDAAACDAALRRTPNDAALVSARGTSAAPPPSPSPPPPAAVTASRIAENADREPARRLPKSSGARAAPPLQARYSNLDPESQSH